MPTLNKEKPLHWVSSAKKDLLALPAQVIDDFGYALGAVQLGTTPPQAKHWRGEGPGVFELVESNFGNTFRAVYTVRFAKAVTFCTVFKKNPAAAFVLHRQTLISFTSGSKSRNNITRNFMKAKSKLPTVHDVEVGSGNVFADLGLTEPDERRLRVQLATRLIDLLADTTQAAVAKRLGISQPHVSELKHFKLGRFSSERLMHFITLMDRDIEIFIRPRSSAVTASAAPGAVSVWAAA